MSLPMTLVMAWLDSAGRMIADSAVTHTGAAQSQTTTFGEASVVEPGRTVEESAFKMAALTPGVLVGISGDVGHALGFLRLVVDDLQREGDVRLPFILESLYPAARDREHFQLIFIHHYQNQSNHITALDSRRGIRRYDATPQGVARSSSLLPEPLQRRIVHSLNAIRELPVDPHVSHHAGLAFVQGMVLSDPMLAHGVGGAFFGATADRGSIRWQEDLLHIELAPEVLVSINQGREIDPAKMDFVRVGVRDGSGFVSTSVRGGRTQAYPSALSELQPFRLSPSMPERIFAPVRFVAIHHRLHRRLVFLDRGEAAFACSVLKTSIEGELVGLDWDPALVSLLETPTPPGGYEVFVVETGRGGRGSWGPVSCELEPTSEFEVV